jgi:hypothetical protein
MDWKDNRPLDKVPREFRNKILFLCFLFGGIVYPLCLFLFHLLLISTGIPNVTYYVLFAGIGSYSTMVSSVAVGMGNLYRNGYIVSEICFMEDKIVFKTKNGSTREIKYDDIQGIEFLKPFNKELERVGTNIVWCTPIYGVFPKAIYITNENRRLLECKMREWYRRK